MKKIFLVCIAFFTIHTSFAQSEQFKKDAKAYVETLGIKAQVSPMKEQYAHFIISDKKDTFSAEIDEAIDKFISNFADLITENYTEKEVKEALEKYQSTQTIAPLPALDNDVEITIKVQQLHSQMFSDIQNTIIKYADQTKINQENQ